MYHVLNYRRIVVLFATILFVTASCKKPDVPSEDLYKNSPSSLIPSNLKGGLWFWGGIGPIAFYDQDGHQVGNGTEAARQLHFTNVDGQGRLEFVQYLGMRNASNCVTEIYTTKKGTVLFEGADKFTFYPVEGSFKTVKKGCGQDGTTTRSAQGDDLKAETYLWEIKTTSLGEPLLYIYEATDTARQNPIFVYDFAK